MKNEYSGNISYRRWLLNDALKNSDQYIKKNNLILDLGGNNNIGKKGFKYSNFDNQNYICLNISKKTNPDVIASAFNLPFKDKTFDVVICTEVFEHLKYPLIASNEIYRVLKKKGVFIGSAPFIFPVHGDPDDYFRFTSSSLKIYFKNFDNFEIRALGGFLGVWGLIIEQCLHFFDNKKILRFILRKISNFLCKKDYQSKFKGSNFLTTGWFWICQK